VRAVGGDGVWGYRVDNDSDWCAHKPASHVVRFQHGLAARITTGRITTPADCLGNLWFKARVVDRGAHDVREPAACGLAIDCEGASMTLAEAIAKASADLDVVLQHRWDDLWLRLIQDGCDEAGAQAVLDEQKERDLAWKAHHLADLPDQLIAAFRSRD